MQCPHKALALWHGPVTGTCPSKPHHWLLSYSTAEKQTITWLEPEPNTEYSIIHKTSQLRPKKTKNNNPKTKQKTKPKKSASFSSWTCRTLSYLHPLWLNSLSADPFPNFTFSVNTSHYQFYTEPWWTASKQSHRTLGCVDTPWPAGTQRPLSHPVFGRPCLEHHAQPWVPLHTRDVGTLERVQSRARRASEGWEAAVWGKAERNGFERRMLGRDLRSTFQFLRDGYKEGGYSLFTGGMYRKRWGATSTSCMCGDSC